jgi:DNA excision repair protein ERCC-2
MKRVSDIPFSFATLQEERSMPQGDLFALLKKFRKGSNVLMAVSGGRISEGLNFPGNQLEMVIIAGIPYPRPDAKNKALYDYYERLTGKGWDYSVKYPTSMKIRQEIGRLIRSESDIGVAIILDKRSAYFRHEIPDMLLSDDPASDAKKFFESFT